MLLGGGRANGERGGEQVKPGRYMKEDLGMSFCSIDSWWEGTSTICGGPQKRHTHRLIFTGQLWISGPRLLSEVPKPHFRQVKHHGRPLRDCLCQRPLAILGGGRSLSFGMPFGAEPWGISPAGSDGL